MEQTKKEVVLENIDGMSFKVESSEVQRDPLPEKEWLLARISNLSKKISDVEGWKDSLKWEFTLLDDSCKDRRIWADTSLYFTQGTKTYNWCIAVIGVKEIAVGSDIKVSDVKNKLCYIMIVPSTKKKGRQVVSDIKHHEKKAGEIDAETEKIKETATKKETKQTQAADTVKSKPKAQEEHATDQIDLDDINLDDV
jgi:hypothetical protein